MKKILSLMLFIFLCSNGLGATTPVHYEGGRFFNYKNPLRSFSLEVFEGWHIYVDKGLFEGGKAMFQPLPGDEDAVNLINKGFIHINSLGLREVSNVKLRIETLRRLKGALASAGQLLPKHVIELARKKNLKFFIMSPYLMSGRGIDYIRNKQSRWDWRIQKKMNISVILHNPVKLLREGPDKLTRIIVHEFAHFYHLEHLSLGDDRVQNMYRTALENFPRMYKGTYAARNHLEFFAETSTTFFLGGIGRKVSGERSLIKKGQFIIPVPGAGGPVLAWRTKAKDLSFIKIPLSNAQKLNRPKNKNGKLSNIDPNTRTRLIELWQPSK